MPSLGERVLERTRRQMSESKRITGLFERTSIKCARWTNRTGRYGTHFLIKPSSPRLLFSDWMAERCGGCLAEGNVLVYEQLGSAPPLLQLHSCLELHWNDRNHLDSPETWLLYKTLWKKLNNIFKMVQAMKLKYFFSFFNIHRHPDVPVFNTIKCGLYQICIWQLSCGPKHLQKWGQNKPRRIRWVQYQFLSFMLRHMEQLMQV